MRKAFIVACAAIALSCASVQPDRLDRITQITFDRGCFGCGGSVVVLRRDGSATLTQAGSARAGMPDVVAHGVITRNDFDQIARVIESQNFFSLRDEYTDPTLVDGTWVGVYVTRDGVEKKVIERNDAGPPALKLIEEKIDDVRRRIAFAATAPR